MDFIQSGVELSGRGVCRLCCFADAVDTDQRQSDANIWDRVGLLMQRL